MNTIPDYCFQPQHPAFLGPGARWAFYILAASSVIHGCIARYKRGHTSDSLLNIYTVQLLAFTFVNAGIMFLPPYYSTFHRLVAANLVQIGLLSALVGCVAAQGVNQQYPSRLRKLLVITWLVMAALLITSIIPAAFLSSESCVDPPGGFYIQVWPGISGHKYFFGWAGTDIQTPGFRSIPLIGAFNLRISPPLFLSIHHIMLDLALVSGYLAVDQWRAIPNAQWRLKTLKQILIHGSLALPIFMVFLSAISMESNRGQHPLLGGGTWDWLQYVFVLVPLVGVRNVWE